MVLWDGSIAEGMELTVKSQKAVEEGYVGCSIAVNGVCLTATHIDTEKVRSFSFLMDF
jgi:riboflavin synthase